MNEWRALIEAFVEARLSADAFKRRFLEAFEAAAAARRPVPAPVQDLYFVVEAYGGDPMGRGHAVADDADLHAAARTALALLPAPVSDVPDMVIIAPSRAEGARIRQSVFAFSTLGCLAGLAYIVIGFWQFFAVTALMDSWLDWGPAPAAILGLILAFIPIVGSVLAFFGAIQVWDWHWAAAAIVFFAFPIMTYISGWRSLRRR